MSGYSNSAQILIQQRKQVPRLSIKAIKINERIPLFPRSTRFRSALQTRAQKKQLRWRRPNVGLYESLRRA
jgi:hypothetical protein